MSARGVDLEIIDKLEGDDPLNVVSPSCVKINGTEVLIPSGSCIRISDITGDDVVTATMTFFVGSLSIRGEVKSDG